MIISHEKDKLINAILYFVTNTKNCYKTKLVKLLFFLDFIHFKQTGKSVTGLKYYAYPWGPYPEELGIELYPDKKSEYSDYLRIVNTTVDSVRGESYAIIAKKKFNDFYFTKRELKILENLAYIFKTTSREQMIEITHLKNSPWDVTLKEKGEKAFIDYMLAIDSDVQFPDELKDMISDRENIEKYFNNDVKG